MEISWLKTSMQVYNAIFDYHREELQVYGTFTDPTGSWPDGFHGTARIMTMWSLKGSDCPLLKEEGTAKLSEPTESPKDYDWKFYITLVKEETE